MMYGYLEFVKDVNELGKFRRMYKQSRGYKNLELAFNDQFTWKRCRLANQMYRFAWFETTGNKYKVNWRSPFWRDLDVSSALLGKVIRAYYKLAEDANSSDMIDIGEGLDKEFLPMEVFYEG